MTKKELLENEAFAALPDDTEIVFNTSKHIGARASRGASDNAAADVPQVVTCKALSLAYWRITGEASSIGVPLRFFINEEN
jgi:hypothetical protein